MERYDPETVHDAFPKGAWQRPAACGPNNANCVEVNLGAEGKVGLRDTKLPGSPVLVFDDEEWVAFLSSVRSGQFHR
ncbi:DUF397 domain-containing protein [Amycolatopsis aidingensis]|uniref:DUF397 domain-containing protein n=1 Tax=Amycolatopsis aidingensis TaxID=2842453 RepID=UPI001C0D2057|nr:DUF397 domain-containing protein [Amycolatopsis aidingensis]